MRRPAFSVELTAEDGRLEPWEVEGFGHVKFPGDPCGKPRKLLRPSGQPARFGRGRADGDRPGCSRHVGDPRKHLIRGPVWAIRRASRIVGMGSGEVLEHVEEGHTTPCSRFQAIGRRAASHVTGNKPRARRPVFTRPVLWCLPGRECESGRPRKASPATLLGA